MASLIPGKVCVVDRIPPCFFCGEQAEEGDEVTPGPYDFATRMGPWASGCEMHYRMYRAAPGLGRGKAQLWVTEDQVDRQTRTIVFPGMERTLAYTTEREDAGPVWMIESRNA